MAKLTFYICLVLFSLVPNVFNEDILLPQQRTELHPALDFSSHTLVKPKIYHGREKRQISSTLEENGAHTDHIEITLEVDGENFVLDLTLNKRLIPKGFFLRHQENGKHKIHKPTAQEVVLCQYSGKVRGRPNSWVALSTCDDLSGVFFDGNELHYIEKNTNITSEDLVNTHFLYKHSDFVEQNKTCGQGESFTQPSQHIHKNSRVLRYKRTAEPNELVRGPYNANKESKYVELVLVVDNREFKELGESKSKVVNHCKNIANVINALYSPLNIFIALVGVAIWSEHDEISFSEDGDITLKNFLHYRQEKLIKDHPNDNAQLLTKFNFQNGVVGKALKGPMCTYEYSGGINTDHSPVVGLVATTIAHEMGHNFGMEHDTNECKCPDDRCIMAPSSTSVAPTHWSSCSLNYLLLAFTHGMDYCLKNKPEFLFESPVCGNGFVERGEQCDCGLPDHCDNFCCNATTCMLHSNASCATGECCDLSTCKPKTAGAMCRSADYECDLPEFCTGQSEYCPPDTYKLDTEVCDGGKAFCYHGFCRTRTDQCKLLWGETGKSSDEQCYEMNKKGNRHGNCGYNKFTKSFMKCDNGSILCGMLHCKHLNERLEFGIESAATLSHSFINKKGSIIPCRTAIVDLGVNQVDPGLTPNGAKCGEGKMCVNQKCMSVSSLKVPSCPKDCNGKGWCNNLGRCHCQSGYAPPFCDYPGPGGSEDSGPASDPNARQGVVTAMFIIFLGIIPMIALIALLSYYAKYNLKFGRKKPPPTTSKSPPKSRGPPFPSETTKRSEVNHSLLHEDSPPPAGLYNEFFGNFKGFTLTPLKKKEVEPVRSAPPPPVVPVVTTYNKPPPTVPSATGNVPSVNVAAKTSLFNKPVQKINSFRNNTLKSGISTVNNASTVPALPPPNPGSNARPIISSPVLESSTSNAKELISPLRNAPKVPIRAAPEAPSVDSRNARPLSTPDPVPHVVLNVLSQDSKKVCKEKEGAGGSALNRITSFLKPADKKPFVNSDSVQKSNQIKANKFLDKNALRNLEISKPIPQTEIDIAITALPLNTEANKAVVMRAQSMRAAKPMHRPHLHTFGSMRQTGELKRPLSIPSANRPKNPPPPRPLETETDSKLVSLTKMQKSRTKCDQNQYDDCLNKDTSPAKLANQSSPSSGDNIYAVIEESPASPLSPEKTSSNSGSSESMGLLGEIVSEIQNRNFDSIYSTSTLNRKKKEAEEKLNNEKLTSPDSSEIYVNTSSVYKSPESEYSNMNNIKSSASSTSSGYILPSAVNVPVKVVDKKQEQKEIPKTGLSSFKSNTTRPFSSTFSKPPSTVTSSIRSPSPIGSSKKNSDTNSEKTINSKGKSTSPTSKTPPRTTVNRQITPPNLRTRKPSPTRPLSQGTDTNRSVTNSPDLVTSCNSSNTPKGPDVLNGSMTVKKPSVANTKPSVNSLPKGAVKPKSVSFKSPQEKKSDVKPPIATKIGKSNSDAGATKATSMGVKNAAKQNSNVASLQQKFENKYNIKATPNVKA